MAFEALVDAIATRDSIQLGSMLEGNLKEAFLDFYETLDEEQCDVLSLNSANFDLPLFTIIDHFSILGASINRSENRLNGLKEFSVWHN